MFYIRISFLMFLGSFLFASNAPGLRVDMKRVETLMEDSFNQSHIEKIQEADEVVLFLGNTQIGKSTLINSLLGCDYERDRKRKARIVLRPESRAEFTKRSDLDTESMTLYPEVHRSDTLPYFLCDTQGFGDTRAEEEIIVSSVLLEMVVNAAKKIKIVIPFSDAQLTDGGKGIRDFCKIIDKLMKTKSFPILFLYNQKNPVWDLDEVHVRIDSLLENERARLQHLTEEVGGEPGAIQKFISKVFTAFMSDKENADPEEKRFLARESVQAQVEKISTLWLLQKMQRQKDEILYVDIFRPESGRESFFYEINRLGLIAKEHFNFGKLSGHRPLFDSKMSSLVNQFTRFIDVKKNFERYGAYAAKCTEHMENYLSYLLFEEERFQKMKNDGVSLPETERRVDDFNRTMDKKLKEIEELKKKISDSDSKIEGFQKKIDSVNTEDLELHRKIEWNEEWYGIYWYRYFSLMYADLPFDSFEETLGDNTKRQSISNKSQDGRLDANYVSDWYSSCSGNALFLIKRKNLETSKIEVINNQDKIKVEKEQISKFKTAIKKLEEENKRLMDDSVLAVKRGQEEILMRLASITDRKKGILMIYQTLKDFSIFNKKVSSLYQEKERRINVWYLICCNLQKTKEISAYNKIFEEFIESYAKHVNPISSAIECSITLSETSTFVNIPCGHIFSQEGIEGLYNANGTGPASQMINCPECRTPFLRGQHVNMELCEVQYQDLKNRYLDTIERLVSTAQQVLFLEFTSS